MDSRTLALLALALQEYEARKATSPHASLEPPEGTMSDDHEDDSELSDLFNMSMQHAMSSGDTEHMRRLMDWASAHGMDAMKAAPTEGIPSVPAEGIPSALIVTKASPIQKAWGVTSGAVIEGWVSTDHEDSDHDIVPPEAFKAALSGYAERRMPLSSEHAMKSYPIGHGQRIALIRDGQVFSQAAHPTDPAEFEHLPSTGSGVYGRFLITEPPAANAVIKGNIGGFSWVGRVSRYDRRPGGRGRIFRQVDPWMESTIAAYPINSRAILLAAKES